MSTIVMRVDLDCDRCYKKIRKVLCKLQDRVNIKTISYDEKSKTVTVSGPFDAEEVSDRLCSDAGKVITDIHVARGNQMMPGAKAAFSKQPGKDGHGGGGGKGDKIKHVKFDMYDDEGIDHRHGGGGKPEKMSNAKFDMGDDGFDRNAGHGHGGGGGKQEKMRNAKFDMGNDGFDRNAGHGHGGGGKPEKMRNAKFDMGNDGFDQNAHHGHAMKPRMATTMGMSRLEAPRGEPPVSMSKMAPMRMPAPAMTMMPQAMATPSIWPAATEWGYSAPAYAGGYYGGSVYPQDGYAPYGGYGRNPCQPQYYEEPNAGCVVM